MNWRRAGRWRRSYGAPDLTEIPFNKFLLKLKNKAHQIINFIKHKLVAGNQHSLHSPYFFNLYNKLVNDAQFYCFEEIEKLRIALSSYPNEIVLEDFGTGKTRKTIAARIIKNSSKPAKQAQFIFKLVNQLKPGTSLEIGTNLGFTTSYIAQANTKGKVYSLEGSESLCTLAQLNFDKQNIKNISLVKGNFNSTLPLLLGKIETLDLVYFDGNHTKEATLNYFQQCLQKVNEQTVFLFDDIYWSAEMTKAWQEIKEHSKVKVSLDLFYFGIVFFRIESKEKEHFKLRF